MPGPAGWRSRGPRPRPPRPSPSSPSSCWCACRSSSSSPPRSPPSGRSSRTAAGCWAQHPTLKAYRDILDGGIVTHSLGVSAGVTLVGTLLSLVCTVTLAYALSRPGVFGGKPVLLLILFTFLFPRDDPRLPAGQGAGHARLVQLADPSRARERVQPRRPARLLPGDPGGAVRGRAAGRGGGLAGAVVGRTAPVQGGPRRRRTVLRGGVLELLVLRLPVSGERPLAAPTGAAHLRGGRFLGSPTRRSARARSTRHRPCRWRSWRSPPYRSCSSIPSSSKYFTKGVLTGAVKS